MIPPPDAPYTVEGFGRYQEGVGSLPPTDRRKIALIARRIVDASRRGSPVRVVRLVGHADRDLQRGAAFERKVSGERALRVQGALVDAINDRALSSRISWQPVAAGATRPVVVRPTSEQERRRNRRVEVVIEPAPGGGVIGPFSPPLVRWVQRCINRRVQPPLPVRGIMGASTRSALQAFQRQRALPVTGTISPPTVTTLGALCGTPPGLYTPRGYAPAASTSFRCAPNPVTVAPATFLPVPTSTPDNAITAVLTTLGLDPTMIGRFRAGGGVVALGPVAQAFGEPALEELLRRLRYSPGTIAAPPHTHGSQLRSRLGVGSSAPLLAARVLLAVPGHFRELARNAPTPRDAHALETLGWLLLHQLRDDIASQTGLRWWVPAPPAFVTLFPNPLPPVDPSIHRIVRRHGLIDTTLPFGGYNGRFQAWDAGPAGAAWRLETGVRPAPQGPGLPFYPQTLTIPAAVNIGPQRARFLQAWQQRVQATDGRFAPGSAASNQALSVCTPLPPSVATLMQSVGFQGLEMTFEYPVRDGVRLLTSLSVLAAIQPVFAQVFRSITDLGWNDLLFQTAGAGCFRGNTSHRRALSDHGFGAAADFNTFENARGPGVNGSMDPRIVALFEAFRFRWGRCFSTPDPMHFEYCGSTC